MAQEDPQSRRDALSRLHPSESAFAAGSLVLGMLVAVLYGYSLRLLFFADDLPIFTWLSAREWGDIWRAAEGGYWRPLTFVVYRLGLGLPIPARHVALHAVNLLWLWASALILWRLVIRLTGDRQQSLVAALLYVAFPFLSTTIPWVTAMGHPMVTFCVLLAAHAALRASHAALRASHAGPQVASTHRSAALWTAVTLLATFAAPLAHESGAVAGAIVAGLILWEGRRQPGLRQRAQLTVAALSLSTSAFLLRPADLGGGLPPLPTLRQLGENGMFFVQGLLYPLAPLVSRLSGGLGGSDFAPLGLAGIGVALLLATLARHRPRTRVWIVPALGWWACAALPALLFFTFPALYIAPRLYSLSAPGIVMLWAGLLVELGRWQRPPRLRRWGPLLLTTSLLGLVLVQNITLIIRDRAALLMLDDVYRALLQEAAEPEHQPMGLINLPSSLQLPDPYPLSQNDVVYVPWYTDLTTFFHVNLGREVPAPARGVYGPLLVEVDAQPQPAADGLWLEPAAAVDFAAQHATVWLVDLDAGRSRFRLREVGSFTRDAVSEDTFLVQFAGGPRLLDATAAATEEGTWVLTLRWEAVGALPAEIFVHVYDGAGALVTQADGAAMSGLVPIWAWQAGTLRDVRYIAPPVDAVPPYTVQVGIYTVEGRLPAHAAASRCPDDACPVLTVQ